MSETAVNQPQPEKQRCPNCDTIVTEGVRQCLMCGFFLPQPEEDATQIEDAKSKQTADGPTVEKEPNVEQETALAPPKTPEPEAPPPPPVSDLMPEAVTAVLRERQSPVVWIVTAVFTIFIIFLGSLVLRFQDPTLAAQLVPTITSVPPTLPHTPTFTPFPTETQPPTQTPTITLTPPPSPTQQPPRLYNVSSGDTLVGLAVGFDISIVAIQEANELAEGAPIQIGQSLAIPWPTPTPPLEQVGIEVNGELVIADPTGCQRPEVQEGDSPASIAARFGIDLEIFLLLNRFDGETILQPGDTVCIPEIIFGGSLPPTPGPTPTIGPTPFPAGPRLLFPTEGMVVAEETAVTRLQWVAVKDLAPDEQYMIELINENDPSSITYRGFTRDTAFALPSRWRPKTSQPFTMRWRVQIVQVTGQRSDGLPIYAFGGRTSADATFIWTGVVPTATPSPTPTATPLPESS